MAEPKILNRHEAAQYIQERTGKPGLTYHRSQMQRWRRYGWLKVYMQGERGEPNLYLVADLDALIAKIKANHRRKRKP